MPDHVEEVKKVLEILKAQLTATKQKIADNDGWDIGDAKDVFEAVLVVVVAVEREAAVIGTLSSADKKALAVDVLNWLIDVPHVPEWIEGKILAIVIDLTVVALNRFFSKNWLSSIF